MRAVPDSNPLVDSHEERIQGLEAVHADMAGTMAALTEQVKQVGCQVEELGHTLGEKLTDLQHGNETQHNDIRKEIDTLKGQVEEQGRSLEALLGDRKASEKRMKLIRKSALGIVLALLGSIATKWGEQIYHWLSRSP